MDSERTYQQFKLSQKSIGDGGSDASVDFASTSSAVNFPVAALTSYLSDNSLLTPESLEILQQIHFQNQSMQKATDSSGAESCDLTEIARKSLQQQKSQGSRCNNKSRKEIVAAMNNAGAAVVDEECMKQIYKNEHLNAALLFAKNNFTSTDQQSEPLNLNLRAKEAAIASSNVVLRTAGIVSHSGNAPSNLQQITSIDGLFNRKRGRPPKNRVVEVYQNVSKSAKQISIKFYIQID